MQNKNHNFLKKSPCKAKKLFTFALALAGDTTSEKERGEVHRNKIFRKSKKSQKKVWWKEKLFIFAAPYEGKEKEVHRKIENIPKTKKQSKYPIGLLSD